MKILISTILLILSLNVFSQNFIPFGEDSIYRPSGFYSIVHDIFVDDTSLYIGGSGNELAGNAITINDIAYWGNNNWNALGNGMACSGAQEYQRV